MQPPGSLVTSRWIALRARSRNELNDSASGSVGERGVFPLPVGDRVGLAIHFGHALVERGLRKLNSWIGHSSTGTSGNRCRDGSAVCCARRNGEMTKSVGLQSRCSAKSTRLGAAELSQWIADLIRGLAAGVCQALAMANKNDSRDHRRSRLGHGLPSAEGVVSFFTRSRGILAVSTARSLCCSIFAECIISRKDASGAVFGCICDWVCSTVFKRVSSDVNVSVA